MSPCWHGCALGAPLWRLLTSLLDIVGNLGKKASTYFLWHPPLRVHHLLLVLHSSYTLAVASELWALGTIFFPSRVSVQFSFFPHSVDADCSLEGVVSLNYLNNVNVQCAGMM